MNRTRERAIERDRVDEERRTEHDYADVTEARSLAGINFILGIWLIISPWILTYFTGQAKWNQFATGIAIAVLAFANVQSYTRYHRPTA